MKKQESLILLVGLITAGLASAELKPLEDEALGDFYGQAAPVIEMSGQITYEAIVYTPPDGGAKEVILPGASSSDGTIATEQLTFSGQTFGMPQTGSVIDQLFMFMPIRMGAVDTDDDGLLDHGATLFSFQPNVGRGTQYSPIDIAMDDTTVNIRDQMFVTKQGILFLNTPLDPTSFQVPGTTVEGGFTPIKYF